MNESRGMAFRVLDAAHGVETRLENALGGLGLSLAKFGVLASLAAAAEPLPLGQLAERCSCVRSNMTQLVDRLEAEKLVQRISDPDDRRCIRAALTPAGRERHAAAAGILDQAEQEVFAALTDADRTSLERLVKVLEKGT